jgi:hypothetical protein
MDGQCRPAPDLVSGRRERRGQCGIGLLRPKGGARESGAGLVLRVAAEVNAWARRSEQGEAAVSLPTGALEPMCEPPNTQMQPTGRTVPSSARVLIAAGDQRNVELCGRGLDRLQLICIPLGHTSSMVVPNG